MMSGTRFVVSVVLVVVLHCCINTGRADDRLKPEINFDWTWIETPFGKPVIDRGSVGEWDHAAVDNPYVYVEDGRCYCFFEAQDTKTHGWHERIGLAISGDGVTWIKQQANPIIDIGPVGAWDGVVAKLPAGVIKRDGSYYLFYSGRDHLNIKQTNKAIGLATATSLAGPWHKHDRNPIFAGRADGWDRHTTTIPAVVFQHDKSYWLLYRGMKGFYHAQGLGGATSSDLLNWKRIPQVQKQPLIAINEEVASIAIAFAGEKYVGISQPMKLANRRYWYCDDLINWKKGSAVKFKASVQAETLSNPFLIDGQWNVLYEQRDRIYRAVLTAP